MADKRINGRVILKHDTEANWNLANNFYPEKGEVVIYDIDDTHNYERFKIGDGVHLPKDLPFYAGSWNDLKDKPLTMAPSGHKHDISGVNGLQGIIDEIYEWIGDEPVSEQIDTAIENKADKEHIHDTLYVNLVEKMPLAAYWKSIAYGGGKFVAVAPYTNQAVYSTDGVNWKASTLPSSSNWMDVTYGNNRFVAIALGSPNAAYSLDGITWSTTYLQGSYSWNSIAYGDGCFIVISSGDSIYAYSYGGTSWNYGYLPTSEFWSDISYDGTQFVISGEYTDIVITGTHNNWNQYYNTSDVLGITKIASNDNQFSVALGSQYNSQLCWSYDGTYWTGDSVDMSMMSDVTYGDGKFVVVGHGDKALYSSNGQTWTQTTLPKSLSWNAVTYGGGKFVAIATYSDTSAVSYDGITWSIVESSMKDNNGNDVVPQVGGLLAEWTQIYDSGEISSDVNAFSDINVSGYKHIMVAIKCVNTTKSTGGVSGAIIFKGSDGRDYAFKNILPNLIKNTTGTSGGMAIFQIINGFIVCENAMRAQSADKMLSDTEGYGADNLTPVGGGIVRCSNPVPTLMVSNANLSNSYYYGSGSRVIVWGCRV